MLRVCVISIQWPPIITGGGGVATFQLTKNIAKRHEVRVYTFGLRDLPEKELMKLDDSEIEVFRVFVSDSDRIETPFDGTKEEEIRRLLEFAEKLLDIIDCGWCDIIHLHGHFVVPSLARALKELGCRSGIVTTIHAFESLVELEKGASEPSTFNTIVELERDALRYSDVVVVASGATINKLYQIHGPDFLDKIRVIPLGIDDKLFTIEKPKARVLALRKKFAGDGYLILNLNRIDPHKGIEYVIEALRYVDVEKPVTLIVAGKFEERNKSYLEKLLDLSEKVKSENRKVMIMRNISEDLKICLYDMANVFVLSSPTEAFGLTILESLARGTPVVVTDAEGPREIFGVGKGLKEELVEVWGGVMVRFDEPELRAKRLAKAISVVLRDLDKYKEKAMKAKMIVKERFSWESISRMYESLYRTLLTS